MVLYGDFLKWGYPVYNGKSDETAIYYINGIYCDRKWYINLAVSICLIMIHDGNLVNLWSMMANDDE